MSKGEKISLYFTVCVCDNKVFSSSSSANEGSLGEWASLLMSS